MITFMNDGNNPIELDYRGTINANHDEFGNIASCQGDPANWDDWFMITDSNGPGRAGKARNEDLIAKAIVAIWLAQSIANTIVRDD